MKITIRHAIPNDLREIVEIMNQAIRTRKLIGYTNEFDVKEREEWFLHHSHDTHPLLVAEYDARIIGWIGISPYRKGREALNKTVEVSYFIHKDYQRRGAGSKLLNEIATISKQLGKSTILAIIFDTNSGSAGLLEKHNFEKWGVLPDVAELDGKKLHHVYYGKKL